MIAMEDKRVRFLKIYANLPLVVREDIVVVINNEPLSWNAAKIEIEQDTPKGKEILDVLTTLKILP